MSKVSFIHLSDIHFIKSSNNQDDIDKDLRKMLIDDLKRNANKTLENVKGILVTGDIAYSGTEVEYKKAKDFLDEVCEIFKIKYSDVYCVPGNHDVNQDIISKSDFISIAHNKIESAMNIDAADVEFSKYISDDQMNILFAPFKNYNDFAKRYECAISKEEFFWEKEFTLADNFKMKIVGINSAFISTKDDGKLNKTMFIGQAQVPDYYKDAATLLMCHHPPEFWKFKDQMLSKLNKRADIQLYGHMHLQSVDFNDENVMLYSGALHPTRTVDWSPRYNWISIDGEMKNDERVLSIEIFPRCLSNDRNRFVFDSEYVQAGEKLTNEINIDRKREKDLSDILEETNCLLVNEQFIANEDGEAIDERVLIYNLCEVSWTKQMEILMKLGLIVDSDRYKDNHVIIKIAIDRAKELNKLKELFNEILEEIS